MKIVVAANAELKAELLSHGMQTGSIISWVNEIGPVEPADAVIDLLFDEDPDQRFEFLKTLPAKIIAISDVCGSINNLPGNFIRINGWPTFLSGSIIEVCCENIQLKPIAEYLFSRFNKKIECLPSTPGFITARIVSMIINEAYFANSEEVSSREDIDIAMKAGTNYPYGPFEWSRRIGIKKIYSLLKKLEEIDGAYKPSDLLTKEATA